MSSEFKSNLKKGLMAGAVIGLVEILINLAYANKYQDSTSVLIDPDSTEEQKKEAKKNFMFDSVGQFSLTIVIELLILRLFKIKTWWSKF